MRLAPREPGRRPRRVLARVLGLPSAVLITVSAVTPASSVVVIAPSAVATAGGAALVSFAVGALLCLAFALCYAELAAAIPEAGGEYSYAARILGVASARAVLVSTLATVVLIVATLASAAGELLAGWTHLPGVLVACGLTTVGVVVASRRITVGARVTGAFLVLELGALVAVTGLGLAHVSRSVSDVLATGPSPGSATSATALAVVAALPSAVFAYNGYASGVFLAEELKPGAGSLARMIFTSLVVVVVVETVPLAAVLLGAPSIRELASSPAPIADFLRARGGEWASTLLLPVIVLAIANAVVAILVQGSRLAFVAARDLAPSWRAGGVLAEVDHSTEAPVRATLLVGALSATVLCLVPPDLLLTLTAASVLVPGAVVAVCVVVGRWTGSTRDGTYRMPAWPVAPVVSLLTIGGIAVVQWRADPARVLAPLVLLGAPLVVGAVSARWAGRRHASG